MKKFNDFMLDNATWVDITEEEYNSAKAANASSWRAARSTGDNYGSTAND